MGEREETEREQQQQQQYTHQKLCARYLHLLKTLFNLNKTL